MNTEKNGLYALVSLDAQPADEQAAAVLGLDGPWHAQQGQATHGLIFRAVDHAEAGRAIDSVTLGDDVLVLVGHMDEPGDLARRVGLAADARPATLALAALQRYGDDTPLEMLGEWSLLHWHKATRRLTLVSSLACRDPMFVAAQGNLVALCPSLRVLSQLSWVGKEFDPAGLLLPMSRARLRRGMERTTPLARADRVLPGTREVFEAKHHSVASARDWTLEQAWPGTFDEAIDALNLQLRHIMRQQFARHARVAIFLSGGLDSSLLAALAAEVAAPGQIELLCSVAPEHSGLPDERHYAQRVADQLGLPITWVCPDPDASAYTPSTQMFEHLEMPIASQRHYLYDALHTAALNAGASTIIDGAYGEYTVSNKAPLASLPNRLREWRRLFKERLQRRHTGLGWPGGAFHVRLSNHAMQALPDAWSALWQMPQDLNPMMHARRPIGMRPAERKSRMTSSASPEVRLRHLLPYRDQRLLRLNAAMPSHFLYRNGMNRALTRTLLKGRVPEDVRLRKNGAPFSPDYLQRLRRQAPSVLERFPLFYAAGADRWIDLDWLHASLLDCQKSESLPNPTVLSMQMSTVAAEFFVWWQNA